MSWWFSCCNNQDGDAPEDEASLHAALLRKAIAPQHDAIFVTHDANSQLSSLSSGLAGEFRSALPDLEEPKSSLFPLCLHRSCADEPENSEATEGEGMGYSLPRRSQSSDIARPSSKPNSLSGDDQPGQMSFSQPSLKRRNIPRKGSPVTLTESGVTAEVEIAESGSLVYSNWFALLSKSIGSDVGSPSWLRSSSKQIEGA